MSNTPSVPPPSERQTFCPHLPAVMTKSALGQPSFILTPCIGAQCAIYEPCQVEPKRRERALVIVLDTLGAMAEKAGAPSEVLDAIERAAKELLPPADLKTN